MRQPLVGPARGGCSQIAGHGLADDGAVEDETELRRVGRSHVENPSRHRDELVSVVQAAIVGGMPADVVPHLAEVPVDDVQEMIDSRRELVGAQHSITAHECSHTFASLIAAGSTPRP
jgi:hypothetical protein